MKPPLVSVVIVTWNRREDVLEAVRSVYDQDYSSVEVVVVDNASADGTVEALRQAYPEVRLVELTHNLGASGGRNPGILAARGEIVFLLDSDASLAVDTLVTVVAKFRERPEVGVIACKVVNAQTKALDQRAGWIFSEKDKVDQDAEFLSYSFSECGCAFRRQVFEEVGLFWDQLFFGREGEELSLRVWDGGYQILYCPKALVLHRVSPDERVAFGRREYYDLRNSLIIYVIRYPWWLLARMLPLRLGVALVRSTRRGRPQQALLAILDVVKQLPALRTLRRPIADGTAHHYLSLQREHGPLRWNLATWLKHKA